MYGPEEILTWLEDNVQGMRQSRRKTVAQIVDGAMRVQRVGVLALGRAMAGRVGAKHCIKRVWRFLRNPSVEVDAVSGALLSQCAPQRGPLVIVVDWTDLSPYKQLVCSVPRDGRALPVLCRTIGKDAGAGAMVAAEQEMLELLERLCPRGREVIVVADRGFGNARWLNAVARRGWYFVQRVPKSLFVDVEGYIGTLREMRLRKGSRVRDWGWGSFGERSAVSVPVRLVTKYAREGKEP